MPAARHSAGDCLSESKSHICSEVPAAASEHRAGRCRADEQRVSRRHVIQAVGKRSSDDVGGVIQPDPRARRSSDSFASVHFMHRVEGNIAVAVAEGATRVTDGGGDRGAVRILFPSATERRQRRRRRKRRGVAGVVRHPPTRTPSHEDLGRQAWQCSPSFG
jgi:hypothetical protein